jgi:hypothetical protein
MTEASIAKAVVRWLYPVRRFVSVPNVWWGLGLSHEADLFCVTPSRYVHEIEIKISKADLFNDIKKPKHLNPDARISYFYYAVPKELVEFITVQNGFNPRAGIIELYIGGYHEELTAKKIKKAEKLPNSIKLSDEDYVRLLELGVMRIWK